MMPTGSPGYPGTPRAATGSTRGVMGSNRGVRLLGRLRYDYALSLRNSGGLMKELLCH